MARTLESLGIHADRVSLEWVSAAEGPRFVRLITDFTARIRDLGPLGSETGLTRDRILLRLEAAKMALQGKRVRMAVARMAKYAKEGGTYREVPPDHKLNIEIDKTLAEERAACELLLHVQDGPRPVDELANLLDLSADEVVDRFKKLEKKNLVQADRLIMA